jgi:hypothetical protein
VQDRGRADTLSRKPSTMICFPCGRSFDGHRLEHTSVHVPHHLQPPIRMRFTAPTNPFAVPKPRRSLGYIKSFQRRTEMAHFKRPAQWLAAGFVFFALTSVALAQQVKEIKLEGQSDQDAATKAALAWTSDKAWRNFCASHQDSKCRRKVRRSGAIFGCELSLRSTCLQKVSRKHALPEPKRGSGFVPDGQPNIARDGF